MFVLSNPYIGNFVIRIVFIAKADKGEALIVITEAEYDAKVRDFLLSSNAVPATFSFDFYNTEIRKAIRESKIIFPTIASQNSVFNMNYSPPNYTVS